MKFIIADNIVSQGLPFKDWRLQPVFENNKELIEYCDKYFNGTHTPNFLEFNHYGEVLTFANHENVVFTGALTPPLDEYKFIKNRGVFIDAAGRPQYAKRWIDNILDWININILNF